MEEYINDAAGNEPANNRQPYTGYPSQFGTGTPATTPALGSFPQPGVPGYLYGQGLGMPPYQFPYGYFGYPLPFGSYQYPYGYGTYPMQPGIGSFPTRDEERIMPFGFGFGGFPFGYGFGYPFGYPFGFGTGFGFGFPFI